MPLSEIVFDFYRQAQEHFEGYASFDYQRTWATSLRSLSSWTSCSTASRSTRSSLTYTKPCPMISDAKCARLKGADPAPAKFDDIAIQAAIGAKIIARETVKGRAQGRDGQATAATYHASASCSKKKKKAKTHAPDRQRGGAAVGIPRRIENGLTGNRP